MSEAEMQRCLGARNLANGTETGGEGSGGKAIADPARLPAIRLWLLHRLSVPDHQCGHGGSAGDGTGARCRRPWLAYVGLLRDLRCCRIPIGILLDGYGPRRGQSALLLVAAGSMLFAVSDAFLMLLAGRALIGLGVAFAMTAGLKALVLWFPGERVPPP